MQVFQTEAIILRRTNYGEADRILTLLTSEKGKLSAIAKGVRKPKSKLAGGLELFATCHVGIGEGRGSMSLVTSARLDYFYGNILHDYDRMQFGYECIKLINRAAETVNDNDFYQLLKHAFIYLNELDIPYMLVELWFRLQLLSLLGHGLNVHTTEAGERLQAGQSYSFDFAQMAFAPVGSGRFGEEHIKLLRLATIKNPAILRQVSGLDDILGECLWLVRSVEG